MTRRMCIGWLGLTTVLLPSLAVAVAGCNNTAEETRRPTTPAEGEGEATPDAAAETNSSGGDPSSVSPEQIDELNHYFYTKVNSLQFNCYNEVAERDHKKYQGNVTVSLVVEPGGRASHVKITESTLASPEIEKCVVGEMKKWEWPTVPGPAPFTGSVSFKPAW